MSPSTNLFQAVDNLTRTDDNVNGMVRDNIIRTYGKMVILTTVVSRKYSDGRGTHSLKDYLLTNYLVGRKQQVKLYDQLGDEFMENNKLLTELAALPQFSPEDLNCLAPGSFAVQFDFKLTSPWTSRDDTPLYVLENPVRKEWVFKVPEMGAAGWKGAFLTACRSVKQELSGPDLTRLFGTANDGPDEESRSGCLKFFPSFFSKIAPYVINPHDRTTKAGRQPIYLETVPQGARSRFTLLYMAEDGADSATIDQDRQLVGTLIQEVFVNQGFGAKTGTGFGRAGLVQAKGGAAGPRPLGGNFILAGGGEPVRFDDFNQLRDKLAAIKEER